MTASEIRKNFIDFFSSKQHKVVPSAPLVIKDDPTLMFTNAGMNQFKNIFLGNDDPQSKRVVNSQKCLRVSGKHNDLEEVGVDTYHHTMFEMLGNWSFGDYFKKEAIAMAWELLTEVYKLPVDRLYITVFEGDKQDGLEMDNDSYEVWKNLIAPERILKGNKKDNFWEMGEIGPCGPSSEIHIDLRPESEIKKQSGKELVNADHPLVVEIWNLVFIEFNRKSDQSLHPLPQKHVDTGMGLERLCMAMQHVSSNYDTDLFTPLIAELENISGKKYEKGENKKDVAFRVISDHIRAVSFSIADSQLPGNTGAGYVIRRILRRAIRYGYSFLDMKEAFMYKLIPPLVKVLGDHFPELKKEKDFIQKVIKEEEENFMRTLDKGIYKIEQHKGEEITGEFAFELYDTFGFPLDLTKLIAAEKNWKVDEAGFQSCLQEQKSRSRKASKIDLKDWVVLKEDKEEEFIGYDKLESSIFITRYREVKVKDKTSYHLVFNLTPFYPEGGGQVGDSGYIESNLEKIEINNTKKENNLIIHYTDKLPSNPELEFKAIVNASERSRTEANHSATHLLHHALRSILGDHVAQKGSLVHPDYLRFDFSHYQKLSQEELQSIENLVNNNIRKAISLDEMRSVPLSEAKEMGAMALFGEKYADVVRVVKFGDSIELCGGTHVENTSNIGVFKIISEASVASGVRRIEALTSVKADDYIQEQFDLIDQIKRQLKEPKDLNGAIQQLLKQNADLQKEIDSLKKGKTKDIKEELKTEIQQKEGVHFLARRVELDAEAMKDISFQLKNEMDNLFMVLGSENGGKALLSVIISENLVQSKKLNAAEIVRSLAKEIQGGGGGQPFYATAGGKLPEGIDKALKKAEEFL